LVCSFRARKDQTMTTILLIIIFAVAMLTIAGFRASERL
jgi:hypothetical protein